MIHLGILDPSPVPAPGLAREPVGRPLDFKLVVRQAGMTDVVSTHAPPSITVHAGERDLRVPIPGRNIYCIAGATLPVDATARAREIMRRLAYGFLDWGARETVSRYHRDLKRPISRPREAAPGGLPVIVKVRRLIRGNPGINVSEIARLSGVAQPNVSRALAALQEDGSVEVRKIGRVHACYPANPDTTRRSSH